MTDACMNCGFPIAYYQRPISAGEIFCNCGNPRPHSKEPSKASDMQALAKEVSALKDQIAKLVELIARKELKERYLCRACGIVWADQGSYDAHNCRGPR